jgi:hypothetical protein
MELPLVPDPRTAKMALNGISVFCSGSENEAFQICLPKSPTSLGSRFCDAEAIAVLHR